MDLTAVIAGEASRMRHHLRGALEYDDLLSTGWLAALTAPPEYHPAQLRLRIRGAIRDAFRKEWRALGRVDQQIFWPVYWPKTFHAPGISGRARYRRPFKVRRCLGCAQEISSGGGRKRCEACAVVHRAEQKRTWNRRAAQMRPCVGCQTMIPSARGRKRCEPCLKQWTHDRWQREHSQEAA